VLDRDLPAWTRLEGGDHLLDLAPGQQAEVNLVVRPVKRRIHMLRGASLEVIPPAPPPKPAPAPKPTPADLDLAIPPAKIDVSPEDAVPECFESIGCLWVFRDDYGPLPAGIRAVRASDLEQMLDDPTPYSDYLTCPEP